MYVVVYCSFIFSVCIFIFYFSSEILAKFSYSVNPRINKVYVCMYVCITCMCILFIFMYGLLTKCKGKMARYCPSSFYACLWSKRELNP